MGSRINDLGDCTNLDLGITSDGGYGWKGGIHRRCYLHINSCLQSISVGSGTYDLGDSTDLDLGITTGGGYVREGGCRRRYDSRIEFVLCFVKFSCKALLWIALLLVVE